MGGGDKETFTHFIENSIDYKQKSSPVIMIAMNKYGPGGGREGHVKSGSRCKRERERETRIVMK